MSRIKAVIRLVFLVIFYVGIFSYWVIFSSHVGWLLFLFLTLLLLLNGLSMSQSLKYLRIKPINIADNRVGEAQTIVIDIYNPKKKRLFYPQLTVKCPTLGIEKATVFFFKKELVIEEKWLPKERGQLTELDIEINSSDFFNLFKKTKRIKFDLKVLILPAKISEYQEFMEFFKPATRKIVFGQQSFDLEKIRAYQSGDAMKQIDWKLSSKQQQLMIREYDLYDENKWLFVFFGRESKYFEEMLAYFFYLYETTHSSQVTFQLIGKGISENKVLTNKSFALIGPSEDPGDLPYEPDRKMIIFTPRKTALLDKALEKLSPRQSVQVIEYQENKGGSKNAKY